MPTPNKKPEIESERHEIVLFSRDWEPHHGGIAAEQNFIRVILAVYHRLASSLERGLVCSLEFDTPSARSNIVQLSHPKYSMKLTEKLLQDEW